MFSVLQTVLLWGLNPHHWLSAFLQACADHGGTCPTDLSAFLPWQMTPERREELARPVPVTLPPFASASQEKETRSSRHLLTPDPAGACSHSDRWSHGIPETAKRGERSVGLLPDRATPLVSRVMEHLAQSLSAP